MRQNWEEALGPFRGRLRKEAFLGALLTGLAAALGALAVIALGLRLAKRPISWMAAGACLLLGMAAGWVFYLLRRPTWKRAAARADELGLQNRAGTMVAYAADDSLLARVQRRDAIAALNDHDPKELPLRLPRGLWIALAATAVCAALSVALPDAWLGGESLPPAQAEETEEARLARELLESLRKRIEEADLSEEERQKLLAELAAAEAGAQAGDMDLDQLAQVMRASGELEQALDDMEWEQGWIYYLLDFERTRPLAEAFIAEDIMALQRALIAEYDRVTAVTGTDQIIALMDLRFPIETSLTDHVPSDNDAYLCYVLSNFANDMLGAAEYVASHADPSRVIYSAFSRLERQLITIINGIDIIVEAEENEDTVYVQREGDGADSEDTAARGKQAGEDLEQADGLLLYTSDPDNMQGAGTGTRRQQHYAETEQVYEPSLDPYSADFDAAKAFRYQTNGVEMENGHVAYGQVYGVYYARLLAALLEGVIPEDLTDAVETYFYGM